MIKTLVRSYSWANPHYVSEMWMDDKDIFGIEYWYKDVKAQHDEMNKKNK